MAIVWASFLCACTMVRDGGTAADKDGTTNTPMDLVLGPAQTAIPEPVKVRVERMFR